MTDEFSETNIRVGDTVRVLCPGTAQKGSWKVKEIDEDGIVLVAKLEEFGSETGYEARFVIDGLVLLVPETT